jgi:hypothetical protein
VDHRLQHKTEIYKKFTHKKYEMLPRSDGRKGTEVGEGKEGRNDPKNICTYE